jgi:signal transduction histidine kinase
MSLSSYRHKTPDLSVTVRNPDGGGNGSSPSAGLDPGPVPRPANGDPSPGQGVVLRSRDRIVEMRDAERRHLAQDLHDLVQGRLVLAAVHAGRLASGTAEPATRSAAADLRRELDDAVTELRRLVHGIMPAPLIERGFLAALEDLADRVPLPVDLDLPPGPLSLPSPVASNAYFIAAEAVANAVKHAAAGRLSIAVAREERALRLEVADDGRGGAVVPGAGMGGMAARAESLDGRLRVDSPAGGGTRVVAWLPCGS